ncbi:hypothetical protein CEK71_18535 [Methylovulum psychrotolerans]|uniref:Uncharacterized protein n=1 Tax=Methylovulum psychrotolerans TaxID=1704499 RepID=A0A1Z4C2Z7_9GAMM|nr:hypothetical protein CEK71_18535 [Methylovulum psychrotolerans]
MVVPLAVIIGITQKLAFILHLSVFNPTPALSATAPALLYLLHPCSRPWQGRERTASPSYRRKLEEKAPPPDKGEVGRGLPYFRLYNRFYFMHVP